MVRDLYNSGMEMLNVLPLGWLKIIGRIQLKWFNNPWSLVGLNLKKNGKVVSSAHGLQACIY